MADDFRPGTPELIVRNERYASERHDASVPGKPSRGLAVVACMDCRIDVEVVLGLEPGDSHVIRNAGGIVTDDVIRSLCLSQRALGTREIVLIHHTKCGVQGLDEPALMADIESETGERPTWSFGSFADPEQDVRDSIARLTASPFVPESGHIRGFVFDVDDGRLIEVAADG